MIPAKLVTQILESAGFKRKTAGERRFRTLLDVAFRCVFAGLGHFVLLVDCLNVSRTVPRALNHLVFAAFFFSVFFLFSLVFLLLFLFMLLLWWWRWGQGLWLCVVVFYCGCG